MITHTLRALAVALCVAPVAAADESAEVSLFDGKTLEGWTTQDGKPVTSGWVVEDGAIYRKERGGNIISTREFQNFELDFDWKAAPGANSGVKYRLVMQGRTLFGIEYQLLDDERHSNAKNPRTSAASMYQLYAPKEDKTLNPAGEWNSSKIVVDGPRLEHWLNGEKVLEAEVGSDEWNELIAKSKFKSVPGFGQDMPTKILLQDHGNPVWFRNIKVKPLTARGE